MDIPDNIASKVIGAYNLMTNATNPNEVARAAEMVQKLVQKYNIQLDLLISKDKDVKVVEHSLPMGGKNQDKFLGYLANVLSQSNFVTVFWNSSSIRSGGIVLGKVNSLTFVGLPKNVSLVIELFQNLVHRLRFMAEQDFDNYQLLCIQRGIEPLHGKSWKADYLLGAVAGINEKLQEQLEQFKKMEYTSHDGLVKTGNELVIVRGAEVEDYMSKNYPKLKNGPRNNKKLNYSAYQTGLLAGKEMEINQKVLR